MAVDLDRDSFDAEVHGSEKPVLVDFWGPRCGPCLALSKPLEEMEKEYAGRLKVAKLNAAENRMLCAKLRVMGLPTLLIYKGGVEVSRLTGENITMSDIRNAVETVLS